MTEQSQTRSEAERDSSAGATSLLTVNEAAKKPAQVAPLPPRDAWKRYCETRLRHFEMAQ
jgi:hypothetical protein